MSQQTDVESDPLLKLLTEALRAGPTSPIWQEAVAQIKSAGGANSDEYQLLLSARESLASGKAYRSVRAGAGFTRKVFADIEHERASASSRPAVPIATIVAILAAIGILAVLGFVAWQLVPRTDLNDTQISALASTVLVTDVAQASFDKADQSIPDGWRTVGSLPLESAGGLHAAIGKDPAGGAIVLSQPLSASEPFSIEVDLRNPHPTNDVVAQVFISASNDFSPDRAISTHELVWQLRGKTQQVFLDGGALTGEQDVDGTDQKIRIVINHDLAVIETGSRKRLWAGIHHLGDGPRYAGVRFIRTGAVKPDTEPTLQSVHVSKK